MTYDTEIEKVELEGLPELYLLQMGDETERWTSYAQELTFLGHTYKPGPIKRGRISSDVKMGAVEVTIAAPLETAFGRHIANQPIEPTVVTIYRSVLDDMAEFVVLFKGSVKRISYRNKIASAMCERASAILDTIIPSTVYENFCNHMVFDSGCGLDNSLYQISATVTGLSGGEITATVFAGYADGYFTGGRVEYGTDMRMITDHVTDTITVHVPFDSRVEVGSVLIAQPGCDGDPDTCKTKFSNFYNFLGMPYVPTKNPVIFGAA